MIKFFCWLLNQNKQNLIDYCKANYLDRFCSTRLINNVNTPMLSVKTWWELHGLQFSHKLLIVKPLQNEIKTSWRHVHSYWYPEHLEIGHIWVTLNVWFYMHLCDTLSSKSYGSAVENRKAEMFCHHIYWLAYRLIAFSRQTSLALSVCSFWPKTQNTSSPNGTRVLQECNQVNDAGLDCTIE